MSSFAERMVKRMRTKTAESSCKSKVTVVQVEPPRRVIIIFAPMHLPMGVRTGNPRFVSWTGKRCRYVS